MFFITSDTAIQSVQFRDNILDNTIFNKLSHYVKAEGNIDLIVFANESFTSVSFNEIYHIYGANNIFFTDLNFTEMTTTEFTSSKTIYEGDLSMLRVNKSERIDFDNFTVINSEFEYSNLIHLYDIQTTEISNFDLENIIL